ncbi:MAG: LPS export ABC transporter permease LptF [Nitrospirota bacterium]
MKIIDRYILMEILPPFVISIFVFTFVLLMNQILRLSDLLINKGIAFFIIFELIIFILPSFLVITIPVSTLTASILAFSRLSSDGEIIALKASGISLYRMIIPVLTFSLFTGIITIYLMISAMPYGNFALKNLIYNTIKTKASLAIEEGVFNDTFENLMIYVKEMPRPEEFNGIFISDLRDPKEPNVIIAKSGTIITDKEAKKIILRLKDGSLHRGAELSGAYQKVDFTNYDLQLNIEFKTSKLTKDRLEMTIGELMDEIDKRKKENNNYTAYLMEIHKKFSMPFACVLMGIIGAPLGITSKRSGRSTGFALAIGIALAYYLISTLGDFLGRLDFINAFLAIWLPNIFFAFFGIFLVVKTANESPFKALGFIFDFYYYVLNKVWNKKK